MHSTAETKHLFFDVYGNQPAAVAAPPRDTAAAKYGVAPTTLNRLLVWAWAATGPIDTSAEQHSQSTARKPFRELAHRMRAFTQPLGDSFLHPTPAAQTQATPSAAAAPRARGTPEYSGPPKGIEHMMARHESPALHNAATLTPEEVLETAGQPQADATATGPPNDDDDGDSAHSSTRRRINETPDDSLSLRH